MLCAGHHYRLSILLITISAWWPAVTVAAEDPDDAPVQVPALGHLEKPEQPPSKVLERRVSPPLRRALLSRGPYVCRQVNVDANGNNILGDAANEPSIGVDPTNHSRMVITWRQFDSVASNFRQAGWAYTTNSGTTWTFPGVLQAGTFRSDPIVKANATGTFFYCSLDQSYGVTVFKSTNGGQTWPTNVTAYGGDKQWMSIDRTNGTGRNNIYVNWQRGANCCGANIFTRSTNGGSSFQSPVSIPNSPSYGASAVGPDGAVYVAGVAYNGSPDWTQFVVARSTNAQNPSATPSFSSAVVSLGGGMVINGQLNPAGILGQPQVAVNYASGALYNQVYLLCSVDTPSNDPLDAMFARSVDGGATWSSPIRVNDDPGGPGSWQWFGTIAVAPTGRIDVIWNDTRNDPNPDSTDTSELFYSYSLNGGLTWSHNIPVTRPWYHSIGFPQQAKIGDYYDMISDAAGADIAFAATFNGEEDVYYLRLGDCNNNGVFDGTDIANGTSLDINGNTIPDECEDCNQNGIPDEWDIGNGTSLDCNHNGVPDECDLASGGSLDCNDNGIPDECDIAAGLVPDCNANGVPDACDIASSLSLDCNGNGVPDECDVIDPNFDCNQNGVPDECETDGRHGLAGQYFDGANFTGKSRGRVDSTVNFDWSSGAPWPDFGIDAFSIRWTGYVQTTSASGTYTFYTRTDDGVRLRVNGQLLVDHWTNTGVTEYAGTISLGANTLYTLVMEYNENTGTALAELRWQPPGQSKVIIPATNLLPARDCNGNGRPDTCDIAATYTASSPTMSPLGGVTQTLTLVSPPDAGADVNFAFTAYGDLNFSNENVAVDINGVPLGVVYNTTGYQDCVANQLATLLIPAATYNAAKAGGNATIHMVPSANVNPIQCGLDSTSIQLTVSYAAIAVSQDVNGNGVPDECESGACCFSNGDCQVKFPADCAALGGSYQGNLTTCTPNPCPQPPAACCLADGSCQMLGSLPCAAQGGTYLGNGVSCTPNPCNPPTGACCYPDGTCFPRFNALCTAGGGIWQGAGTVCTPTLCPQPAGACCSANGSCQVLTAAECTQGGGTYRGDHTVCEPNPCMCRGDADCDGHVAFSDIDYFVAAIPDDQAAWQALYAARHGGATPPCPFANCDITGDGHVNFADIDPFVALIPSACP